MRKLIRLLVIVLVCGIVSHYSAPYLRQLLLSTGYIEEQINIAGTGSMYPTFPKGSGTSDVVRAQETVAWPKMRQYPSGFSLFGHQFYGYTLRNGDIVEIQNTKTDEITKQKYGEEAGFVKRLIAVGGDTIQLRDGFVYLNGKLLNEPYTAKPRSTYGGSFLADCEVLTIPKGKVFVMGDNRKASLDSRYELGLLDEKDIHFVLPWSQQDEYRANWRDSSQDASLANTTTLDAQTFVNLLNERRKKDSLPSLKLDSLLSASGKIRGDAMIKFDDFSTAATKSGMTLEKSITQSGYSNIIFAEVFTRGFYEADELIDNFLEFPDTKNILFSKQYQEIGIAPVLSKINNCPVQVVVAHLGGYVPPNYKKSDLESWDKLIKNIQDVLPTWEAAKNADGIDQTKLARLLAIMNTRLANAKVIAARIRANQWLTDREKRLVDDDKSLGNEASGIIADLNKR